MQYNNYVLLTAQEKYRLSNIINMDYLSDIGVSFYSLSKLVPENVTYYNLKDSLYTITDMSIAGYYLSKLNILTSNNKNLNVELSKYNSIIKNCLDKLDDTFVDTSKTRILYSYFNKLITISNYAINLDIDLKLTTYTLLDIYYKFINFSLNNTDLTLIDYIFLQYCLNDYLKLCQNENIFLINKKDLADQIISSMNLIDIILLVKTDKEYFKSIKKLQSIFKHIKNINEKQFSLELINKDILKLDNNTKTFLEQFNPYLLNKVNKIISKFATIKDIYELTSEDDNKTIFTTYKKASIYEKPFLLHSERIGHIVELMKTKMKPNKIKNILLDNNIDINDVNI